VQPCFSGFARRELTPKTYELEKLHPSADCAPSSQLSLADFQRLVTLTNNRGLARSFRSYSQDPGPKFSDKRITEAIIGVEARRANYVIAPWGIRREHSCAFDDQPTPNRRRWERARIHYQETDLVASDFRQGEFVRLNETLVQLAPDGVRKDTSRKLEVHIHASPRFRLATQNHRDAYLLPRRGRNVENLQRHNRHIFDDSTDRLVALPKRHHRPALQAGGTAVLSIVHAACDFVD